MRIMAVLTSIIGLALVIFAYSAWGEYRSYTVTTEGVVSQRTPTFCAVRLEDKQPGGQASVELQYSIISGTRSDVPPADGPKFNRGDKVSLIHPLGQPSKARLKDGFAPAVPPLWGWLGLGLMLASGGIFLAANKRRG